MARAEPEIATKVKVIQRWGPFGINPFVVNPHLDAGLKQQLRSVFLEMDRDPQGKAILHDLLIDRFVVPDDSIYDGVREMRSYLSEHGLGPEANRHGPALSDANRPSRPDPCTWAGR